MIITAIPIANLPSIRHGRMLFLYVDDFIRFILIFGKHPYKALPQVSSTFMLFTLHWTVYSMIVLGYIYFSMPYHLDGTCIFMSTCLSSSWRHLLAFYHSITLYFLVNVVSNIVPTPTNALNLLRKSHVPYPTMHHFVTQMGTCVHISIMKWCLQPLNGPQLHVFIKHVIAYMVGIFMCTYS